MFLTRRQRILGSLVLAAGAVASIATSQIDWSLSEHFDLTPEVTDEALPELRYDVHVAYTGKLMDPSGDLSIGLTVEKEPAASGAPSLHVEILDVATGEIVGEQDWAYDATFPEQAGPYFSVAAWVGCADGCSEDFTIRVVRTDPITDAPWPQLRITGGIDLYLEEVGRSEAPADATLTLDVVEGAP